MMAGGVLIYAGSDDDGSDGFAELPALAERLGVVPSASGSAGLFLTTKDDKQYDFIKLLNAALDRMVK